MDQVRSKKFSPRSKVLPGFGVNTSRGDPVVNSKGVVVGGIQVWAIEVLRKCGA